ncbi:MAG: YkgJ family cysteine cluster protein [Anaerolineales bacterium]|nr:YkgJ family cysteine cluster protein [Anaerolineales bacterium]
MSAEHVCLRCGACCATYRVSFYWAEAAPELGGEVPPDLTEQLDANRAVMRGTRQPPVRCAALAGDVGRCVQCAIYAARPSPCREFRVSWEDGAPNEACDRARLAWNLPPLQPHEVLPLPQVVAHRLADVMADPLCPPGGEVETAVAEAA